MKQETNPDTGSSADDESKSGVFSPVASWILGFGLIVFAGVSDGAFGISVFGQLGTFAWLLLALGLLLGLFPLDRPGPGGWAGIALWLGLAAWAVLGLLWTDSPDKTWIEVARLLVYAGVFTLALASRGRDHLPEQIGSLAAGITVIAGLALLSRFQPDLFPSATDTGEALTSEASRLSFPLDYWNGLAALVAIGFPLLLELAAGAKRLVFRGLATAAIPLSILTVYFTFSRGGILATVAAVAIYFCLTDDRLRRLVPAAIGLVGGAVLVLLAKSQTDLREGLTNASAHSQGDTVMWVTIGVLLLTGVLMALVDFRFGTYSLPQRFRPGRRNAWIASSVVVVLAAGILLVAGAPGKVSSGWDSFKSAEPPAHGSARLEAANGNGRYQYWSSAVKQWKTAPIAGEGAGTYEFWWAEKGDRAGFIRDTHSLYFQTLGESGLIGLLLLLGLLGLILVTGWRSSVVRVLGKRSPRGNWIAAATGGCVAFILSAGLDWSWQLPAVVFPFLLLSATILSQSTSDRGQMRTRFRIAAVVVPLIAVVLIAVPLSASHYIDQSQERVRDGDLTGALDAARSAHAVSPSTAAPLIQEAGVLESLGEFETAIDAARRATEAEPVNWRNWLILSTIEARHGQADQAIMDFREAKRLNPRSQLFTSGGNG
jgi:hypothetical protein